MELKCPIPPNLVVLFTCGVEGCDPPPLRTVIENGQEKEVEVTVVSSQKDSGDVHDLDVRRHVGILPPTAACVCWGLE